MNLTIKALKDASCDLPRSKCHPHVKPYWNEALTCLKKDVKLSWHKWTEAGRPPEAENEFHSVYEKKKKLYRQALRATEWNHERQWAQDVLDSEEVGQKVFWCLVNRRRNIRGGPKMPIVKSKNYNTINQPQELAEAWAEHFEALATPSMNNEYDYDFQKKTETDLQGMYADSFGNRNQF